MYRSHVLVCGGTGCTSSNSQKIIEAMEAEIKAKAAIPKCSNCGKNCTPEEAERSTKRYGVVLCPICHLNRATDEAKEARKE